MLKTLMDVLDCVLFLGWVIVACCLHEGASEYKCLLSSIIVQ